MRAVYWVMRRELAVTLRAPIADLIGGLFLVVQGIAFGGNLDAMANPQAAAPLGALLEGQLAGTLLTWVLQLVALTLLGMRAIADDRRTGAWELLLTARVSERAAVLGKWLAATLVYALLWVPTLAYLGVVAIYRSGSGGWDLGSIAVGYAGAIAMGGALLAWTVAASAATANPLVAGAAGFAAVIALFLVGELGPFVGDHATLAAIVDAVSLRGHLLRLARGDVAAATLALLAGLAVVGLSLATALAGVGRRRDVRRRFAATALLAAIALGAGIELRRHPLHWDASAAARNTLDPRTEAALAALDAPATLTIIAPTLGALEPLYDEVARVAARFADASPRVRVRRVDPASAPGGLTAVARAAGLAPGDLAASGAVVVELGGRRRVADVFQLATIERGQGGPVIERVAIERALATALVPPQPLVACATTGHGELPLVADPRGADWAIVVARLADDAVALEPLPAGPVPARCRAVIVAGPTAPLSPEEALALQTYVRRGGGLLVAAASRMVGGGLAPTGLEGLLDGEGLGLPAAIAVDPTLAVRELPGALLVASGYQPHPVNAGFAGKRATLWFQPRVVTGTPLVSATGASWGERDLVHGPPVKDPDDLGGPVILAAVGAHRVIALGSAESFTSAVLSGGASAGDAWLARAVRWVAGEPLTDAAIAERTPDQLRLVMTDAERHAAIAVCVGGIPLAWLVLGGAIVWLRRRRAPARGA